MGTINKPNTFNAGGGISASEHNSNYDTIYNEFNGNIENVNVKAGAGIVASKVNFATMPTVGATSAGKCSFTNATVTDLSFPATQVPSAGANVLDDYEEGNWTMTAVCATSGTITLTVGGNNGYYTKIGRVVHVSGRMIVDSVALPVGEARISLPFTASNGNSLPCGSVALNGVDIDNAAVQVTAELPGDVEYFRLTETFDAAALQVVDGADFSAGDEVRFSLTYFTL